MALVCTLADLQAEQCGGTLGGVKRVWALGVEDLVAITLTDHVITGITQGANFVEIGTVAQDGATQMEELNDRLANNGALTFTQTVTVLLNKIDSANRVIMEGIEACCDLVLIVEHGDGSRQLVGVDESAATPYYNEAIRAMRVTASSTNWGNPGQGALKTVTFTGITARESMFISPSFVIND